MSNEQELFYTIAFTRLMGFNQLMALQLYRQLGSGQAVYEHRNNLADVIPDCSPRLRESLRNWDDALRRAAAEMQFIAKGNIRPLTINDRLSAASARMSRCTHYPLLQRLCQPQPAVCAEYGRHAPLHHLWSGLGAPLPH